MTKDQQKIVDGFHERVIDLIYKRRRSMNFGSNGQLEYDQITAEINKIEDERRRYEGDCRTQRSQKPKIEGSVPEVEVREEPSPAETEA
jgi:hypothetical protein